MTHVSLHLNLIYLSFFLSYLEVVVEFYFSVPGIPDRFPDYRYVTASGSISALWNGKVNLLALSSDNFYTTVEF